MRALPALALLASLGLTACAGGGAGAATVRLPAVQANEVRVCHEGTTTTIERADLQAHLDHGDTRGACAN